MLPIPQRMESSMSTKECFVIIQNLVLPFPRIHVTCRQILPHWTDFVRASLVDHSLRLEVLFVQQRVCRPQHLSAKPISKSKSPREHKLWLLVLVTNSTQWHTIHPDLPTFPKIPCSKIALFSTITGKWMVSFWISAGDGVRDVSVVYNSWIRKLRRHIHCATNGTRPNQMKETSNNHSLVWWSWRLNRCRNKPRMIRDDFWWYWRTIKVVDEEDVCGEERSREEVKGAEFSSSIIVLKQGGVGLWYRRMDFLLIIYALFLKTTWGLHKFRSCFCKDHMRSLQYVQYFISLFPWYVTKLLRRDR